MITDEVLMKLTMWKDHEYQIYKHDTLGETIEHIERLLAENERLREALRQLAEIDKIENGFIRMKEVINYTKFMARCALGEKTDD
jgi:hypothetical protein